MALVGITGRKVNNLLLFYAFEQLPSLIIDCANVANPHKLFPTLPFEKFPLVYVVEIELIYSFRDIMRRLPGLIQELQVEIVVITTFQHLFNYQDEEENNNIYEHAWELMKHASKNKHILVGVHNKHLEMAKRYCDQILSQEEWLVLGNTYG